LLFETTKVEFPPRFGAIGYGPFGAASIEVVDLDDSRSQTMG
jgi:hypothetical protein